MKSIRLDVSDKNAKKLYNHVLMMLDKYPTSYKVSVCFENDKW